ncbi:MAG TPA: YkgJ family cysteine cluster protein [Chitinophagaceae bacterium]|jgi:Fe-S-cluster containining protein|nr:YkgJ family cysteine cluster protein [Chitinophagaceae bacterium]
MQPINLRSFKQKARLTKSKMRRFLTKLENDAPRGLDKKITEHEKNVWLETDCLSCANCCKTMTPTFTTQDLNRISKHFNMTVEAFQKKWLRKEKGGDRDWLNKTEPCQFLNLKDNKCSIYEVRPADCAGFPHLSKKFKDYVHIHKQNVEYCPATYRLVEKMMEKVDNRQ